jgi:hypothetical protein
MLSSPIAAARRQLSAKVTALDHGAGELGIPVTLAAQPGLMLRFVLTAFDRPWNP